MLGCAETNTKKLSLLVVGWFLLCVLFGLAWAFAIFPGDERALLELVQWRVGWLDTVATVLSGLGFAGIGLGVPVPWVPITFISGLLVARRWVDAVFLAAALLAPVINIGLKELVARARPDPALALVQESGFSFPSGHAVFAAAFFGALIVLTGRWSVLRERSGLRGALRGTLLLLILAVGASRVYLGAHWPSDVIAGFLSGGIYLAGLLLARKAVMTKWERFQDAD